MGAVHHPDGRDFLLLPAGAAMKRSAIILVFLALAGCSNLLAQLPYRDRADSIQAFFRTGAAGDNYFSALARIMSAGQRDEGIAMLRKLVMTKSTEVLERYRLSAVYLFASDFLPDSVASRMRYIWATVPVNLLYDEHDRVLYYSTLYLMTEKLGPAQSWFNGRSSADNHADAADFLRTWMADVTREGQQEFDSPTYGPLFIASMLLLHRFTADAEMRLRAETMTTWLLADYAHEYLGGWYGGAHAREELYSAMHPIESQFSALAWLYFGDGPQVYALEQLLASFCDYRPPEAVVELAVRKLKPFEAFEMKRSVDRLRNDSTRARLVPKYTYIDPTYMIGSIPGGVTQYREQHTWDATWPSLTEQSTIFTMQPYAEQDGLSDFFPHSPITCYRLVTMMDPYYATITKTVGGSPYERIFQHRNTVIALYDIPDIKRFPLCVGFMPKDVKSFDNDSLRTRWITMDAGDVYAAYYPFKPFVIYPEDIGQRLYSRDRRNGAIVQIVNRSEAGNYKDFVAKIRASKIDLRDFDDKRTVRYTTIKGDALSCTFDGSLSVNGKEQTFDTSKLFQSPWLDCTRGTGVLRIKTRKGTIVVDMNKPGVYPE
jgi:hypothetical protein